MDDGLGIASLSSGIKKKYIRDTTYREVRAGEQIGVRSVQSTENPGIRTSDEDDLLDDARTIDDDKTIFTARTKRTNTTNIELVGEPINFGAVAQEAENEERVAVNESVNRAYKDRCWACRVGLFTDRSPPEFQKIAELIKDTHINIATADLVDEIHQMFTVLQPMALQRLAEEGEDMTDHYMSGAWEPFMIRQHLRLHMKNLNLIGAFQIEEFQHIADKLRHETFYRDEETGKSVVSEKNLKALLQVSQEIRKLMGENPDNAIGFDEKLAKRRKLAPKT